MQEKSANQLWKESGTTLPFKEWLNREKEKYASADGSGDIILNKPLNDSVQRVLEDVRRSRSGGATGSNTIFGLNKTVVVVAGVIIIAAIGYKIYQNQKS